MITTRLARIFKLHEAVRDVEAINADGQVDVLIDWLEEHGAPNVDDVRTFVAARREGAPVEHMTSIDAIRALTQAPPMMHQTARDVCRLVAHMLIGNQRIQSKIVAFSSRFYDQFLDVYAATLVAFGPPATTPLARALVDVDLATAVDTLKNTAHAGVIITVYQTQLAFYLNLQSSEWTVNALGKKLGVITPLFKDVA